MSALPSPGFTPPGWPVVEPELLMGYVGSIMAIRIGGKLSATGLERYFVEWERAVTARPPVAAIFALYDMPEWPGMNAVQRKQWAGMLKRHEETLRRTTRGMVLATPSAVTRGAARAIFWLAPPPYPYAVVDTPAAALSHIAERGGPPAAVAGPAYEAFVRKHWSGSR